MVCKDGGKSQLARTAPKYKAELHILKIIF